MFLGKGGAWGYSMKCNHSGDLHVPVKVRRDLWI